MTFSEYGDYIEAYWDDVDRRCRAQWVYMRDLSDRYQKTVGKSLEKKVCAELLRQAVYDSTSGNSIVRLSSAGIFGDEAKRVGKDLSGGVLDTELGELLLTWEIYEEDGDIVVDAVFEGVYVPEWQE